jgi:hypothetical protein
MRKGDQDKRILGRRLARELTREELGQATGGWFATMTLRWPPDIDPGWSQVRL